MSLTAGKLFAETTDEDAFLEGGGADDRDGNDGLKLASEGVEKEHTGWCSVKLPKRTTSDGIISSEHNPNPVTKP